MLKTNSNAFRVKVQQYIIDRLDTDETSELTQQLQNTVDGFYNWYQGYEVKRTPNKQKAFGDWLSGLPSELSIEFTHYDVRNTVSKWFEQTETESNKYDDMEVWERYLYLIAKEFETLCKKHQVKF